jgi:organic radical activating enzyme
MIKPDAKELYHKHIKDMNNSWCPVPWGQVSVHNSGEYRSCIQARSCKKTRGILRDDNNNIMRADTHSIDEVRNSPLLKDVRKSMIQGKRHDMCVRCNREDDAGVPSRRRNATIEYYDKYNYDYWKALSHCHDDGQLMLHESEVLEYDIRLGNLCNLKCRMCHPSESTQWYDEWFDTMFKGFNSDFTRVEMFRENKKIKLKNDIYSWYDDSKFFNEVNKNSNSTRKIYFSGGEPTLVENMYDMLEKIIDSGMAKNIELEYNINLTNIPRRAIDVWHNFKQVTLGGSIDAVGEYNNYIRYPSKWNKIEENIKWLDQNTNPNINFFCTSTWQILNATQILDLIKWQIENKFVKFNRMANSVFFSFHTLSAPTYLNVKALPKELKQHVQNEFDKFDTEYLKPWIDSLPQDFEFANTNYEADWNGRQPWDNNRNHLYEKVKTRLDTMMEFMWADDFSEHFPEFVKVTRTQDRYRNQNFDELYPEISTYIKREKL